MYLMDNQQEHGMAPSKTTNAANYNNNNNNNGKTTTNSSSFTMIHHYQQQFNSQSSPTLPSKKTFCLAVNSRSRTGHRRPPSTSCTGTSPTVGGIDFASRDDGQTATTYHNDSNNNHNDKLTKSNINNHLKGSDSQNFHNMNMPLHVNGLPVQQEQQQEEEGGSSEATGSNAAGNAESMSVSNPFGGPSCFDPPPLLLPSSSTTEASTAISAAVGGGRGGSQRHNYHHFHHQNRTPSMAVSATVASANSLMTATTTPAFATCSSYNKNDDNNDFDPPFLQQKQESTNDDTNMAMDIDKTSSSSDDDNDENDTSTRIDRNKPVGKGSLTFRNHGSRRDPLFHASSFSAALDTATTTESTSIASRDRSTTATGEGEERQTQQEERTDQLMESDSSSTAVAAAKPTISSLLPLSPSRSRSASTASVIMAAVSSAASAAVAATFGSTSAASGTGTSSTDNKLPASLQSEPNVPFHHHSKSQSQSQQDTKQIQHTQSLSSSSLPVPPLVLDDGTSSGPGPTSTSTAASVGQTAPPKALHEDGDKNEKLLQQKSTSSTSTVVVNPNLNSIEGSGGNKNSITRRQSIRRSARRSSSTFATTSHDEGDQDAAAEANGPSMSPSSSSSSFLRTTSSVKINTAATTSVSRVRYDMEMVPPAVKGSPEFWNSIQTWPPRQSQTQQQSQQQTGSSSSSKQFVRPLQDSVLWIPSSRQEWEDCSSELLAVCTSAAWRQRQKKIMEIQQFQQEQPDQSQQPQLPPFLPPLSKDYIQDRLQIDDPLHGYQVRHRQGGWLQGFLLWTNFTTWVHHLKFDSTADESGIPAQLRQVRRDQRIMSDVRNGLVSATSSAAAAAAASKFALTPTLLTTTTIDTTNKLATALQSLQRYGSPDEGGIVLDGVAEIALVGGLGGGCGEILLRLAIEHIRNSRYTDPSDGVTKKHYKYVLLQATSSSRSFYERFGFKRIGAVCRYGLNQSSTSSSSSSTGRPRGRPRLSSTTTSTTSTTTTANTSKDPTLATPTSFGPVQGYRHWTHAHETQSSLDLHGGPSYMMCLELPDHDDPRFLAPASNLGHVLQYYCGTMVKPTVSSLGASTTPPSKQRRLSSYNSSNYRAINAGGGSSKGKKPPMAPSLLTATDGEVGNGEQQPPQKRKRGRPRKKRTSFAHATNSTPSVQDSYPTAPGTTGSSTMHPTSTLDHGVTKAAAAAESSAAATAASVVEKSVLPTPKRRKLERGARTTSRSSGSVVDKSDVDKAVLAELTYNKALPSSVTSSAASYASSDVSAKTVKHSNVNVNLTVVIEPNGTGNDDDTQEMEVTDQKTGDVTNDMEVDDATDNLNAASRSNIQTSAMAGGSSDSSTTAVPPESQKRNKQRPHGRPRRDPLLLDLQAAALNADASSSSSSFAPEIIPRKRRASAVIASQLITEGKSLDSSEPIWKDEAEEQHLKKKKPSTVNSTSNTDKGSSPKASKAKKAEAEKAKTAKPSKTKESSSLPSSSVQTAPTKIMSAGDFLNICRAKKKSLESWFPIDPTKLCKQPRDAQPKLPNDRPLWYSKVVRDTKATANGEEDDLYFVLDYYLKSDTMTVVPLVINGTFNSFRDGRPRYECELMDSNDNWVMIRNASSTTSKWEIVPNVQTVTKTSMVGQERWDILPDVAETE